MYIPSYFEEKDFEKNLSFIKHHSFGILFSQEGKTPEATHIPFLLKKEENEFYLIGHMAKANPHWKTLTNKEALIVFQGPHAYISASWYEDDQTVSTWNYSAVHCYGEVTVIEDHHSLLKIVEEATNYYEQQVTNPIQLSNRMDYVEKLLNGIVGISFKVTKIEAKNKLSQNHSNLRREMVIENLETQDHYDSKKIAELMKVRMSKTE